MTGIYRGILDRIALEPAEVLERRISLPVWEKAWVAARSLGRRPRKRARGDHEGGGVSRVTVVGGGLAGITAALDCADAGASVTLLESRGRLGGAAYSFTRDGIHADNGQHVFLRCCTAYRELLERIGAGDGITLQDRLEIPVLVAGAPSGAPVALGASGAAAPRRGDVPLPADRRARSRQRCAGDARAQLGGPR